MKNFYASANREAAVAQIMADHADYVEKQARLEAHQIAALAFARAATPPEELVRDDLFRVEPWRF